MPKVTIVAIMTLLLAGPAAAAPLAERADDTTSSASAQVSVASTSIVVGGRPFFPIMVLGQCTAADVVAARRTGVNLFISGECQSVSAKRQLAIVREHGLAVLPVANGSVRGNALAGWTYPDEPEGSHWTPEGLQRAYASRPGTPDGLLSFMTTGAGFFTHDPAHPRSVYRAFARIADVSGFDLYPLGHCHKDLVSVYDAQRDFVGLAGVRPTFQWIETGPIVPTYCGGFQMLPDEVRAEVWLAITGGATGIGYFTQTWSPQHKTFDIRSEIAQEMRRTNRQLTTLTPALLGSRVPISADTGAIKTIARRANGSVYVFAVNSTRGPVKVQLHVPGLGNRNVRAIDENRTLRSDRGRLIDDFAPLAVHLYVVE